MKKKKGLLYFLIFALMLCTVSPAAAETAVLSDSMTMDGVKYMLDQENSAVVGYTDTIDEDITILGSVNLGDGKRHTIAYIAEGAFKDCSQLKSIRVAGTVKEVGDQAFYGCGSLQTVKIPESVKKIGSQAFYGCSALKSIEISSKTVEIGENAFEGCSGLETVYFTGTEEQWEAVCSDDIKLPDNVTVLKNVTLLSDAMLSLSSNNITFNGNNIRPGVHLGIRGQSEYVTLEEGVHYKVTWFEDESVNVGTYKVAVTGIEENGCYGYKEANYTIVKKNINYSSTLMDVSVTPDRFTYDGTVKVPEVRLIDKGSDNRELEAGVDYSVSCLNNVDAGTATVRINGKGNYYGSISKTFDIEVRQISPSVTLSVSSCGYTGGTVTPAVTVKDGGTKLVKDKDYTLSFSPSERKNIGTYTVKVKLKGNYSGAASKTFRIVKGVNPLKVTGKTAKIKYKKLKKKARSLKRSKVITVSSKQGKVTYKLKSAKKGSKKIKLSKAKKYFKINLKTGRVKVKKGLGKGIYKVRVKVNAAGNANYNGITKTVTFKIKVK